MVVCLDNFCDFYDPQTKKNNIKAHLNNPMFKLYEVDIRDQAGLDRVFAENEFDMVIHLAAMAGVRPSLQYPALYNEVNIKGTLNMLMACQSHQISRFIFASSSSVYGNAEKVPFSEEDPVDNPISMYAATKKAGELLCHTWHHLYQMSILCLRFFTVYGPGQRPDLAIHKFARKIIREEPIQVFGDGDTYRDYTYVSDIIDGICRAMEYVENNVVYDVVNLGESVPISLQTMIQTLEKALGNKAHCQKLPLQPGDVQRTFADISKAHKLLAYEPKTTFDDGIDQFVKWLKRD